MGKFAPPTNQPRGTGLKSAQVGFGISERTVRLTPTANTVRPGTLENRNALAVLSFKIGGGYSHQPTQFYHPLTGPNGIPQQVAAVPRNQDIRGVSRLVPRKGS